MSNDEFLFVIQMQKLARQFDNELLMKENRQKLIRKQLTFLVLIQDEPSNIEIKLVGKT